MSRFSSIAALSLLLLAGCDRQTSDGPQQTETTAAQKTATKAEIDRSHAGDLMPTQNVTDPSGNALNLGALQGTPVLLNLWATWCAPCIEEMPQLDELAAELGSKVRVVTVSQDLEGAEKVEPFFAKNDFANLQPWLDPDNRLGFAYGANLPITVLYDASGREVWRVAGGYDWSSPQARGAIDEGIAPKG
ncbi:TlpA family protein disulfide reductase [Erythrobacter sp. LQ02-29]|uniref:TlpA family protein disulfide reductase n=1 Tax=Erythrobacter sp. LQ02-29 TaxID=2920384 RepID=UPI001F4D70DF|nr:TlpA disulfide reductase family protein [Erythrobacter sp. LQ02-29]MCP9222575.1 TlpA family protein disulfide reductase [Erythrobacter sp. LQ02-29]